MSATTPKKNRPAPQRPEESSAPPCPPPSSLSSESTRQLPQQLKTLRLPMFREHFQSLAETGRQETWSYPQFLAELTQRECQARDQRRIARLLAASKLPLGKTWEQFDWKRLLEKAARHLRNLRDGAFLERATNVLLFGRPGSGKTHALAALGEQLARQGRCVLFTSCSLLVQDLLAAKRDLKLHRLIKRLQAF